MNMQEAPPSKCVFALISLTILLLSISCSQDSWPPILNDGDSILFVGSGNVGSQAGLHNHFRRVVTKANPPISVATDWVNMFNRPTLEDMYTDALIERIRTGGDDLVILSSGSSEAMQQFSALLTESGKRFAFFATWADNPFLDGGNMEAFQQTTREEMERLKKFEQETGIPIIPTGLIFYDLLVDPVPFEGLRDDYLFVPEGSVQNDLGTMVNLSAIYAVVTGQSPVGLPLWNPFPVEMVEAIHQRVWEIVKSWKANEVVIKPLPEIAKKPSQNIQMSTDPPKWEPLLSDGNRIYYVGNSFIGTEGGLENHFPRMLASVTPSMDLFTKSDIFWGRGLGSMYTEEVREEIRTGEYDIVVVTSGPIDLLRKFHEDIKAAGSQMVVHMTWGRNPTINEGGLPSFREQTIRMVEEMQSFEEETGVPIVPCGLIFYDLIVDPPAIEKGELRTDWVFMVENIHQNFIGTMSNAAAHYAVMTGKSPVGLPMWDPFPPELVEAVQQRAWKIVQDWKDGRVEVSELPD